MAAERIGNHSDWVPPEDIGNDTGPKPILVETDKFTVSAISMYDMPSIKVIDIMASGGQMQMLKMIDLFRLAITNPAKVEDFEILSFNELTEAVAVWVNKSEPDGDPDPRLDSDTDMDTE